MNLKNLVFSASGAILGLALTHLPAQAISFNINWTGSSGYTMTGMFSYADSLIGTGAITGSSLDSFMIEVFQNGGSLGTWQPSQGGTFNFNFNTTTQQFLVGGNSFGPTGQLWGNNSSTVGFLSGNAVQGITVIGSPISISQIPTASSTLTATLQPAASVPEPASIFGLFAVAGVGGIALRASQKSKVKSQK